MKQYTLTNEDGQSRQVYQISESEYQIVGSLQIHHASDFGYECLLSDAKCE